MKIKTNLVSGVLAVLVAVALLIVIPTQIHSAHRTNEFLDSGFVPKIVAYVILAAGVVMLVKSLVLKQEQEMVLDVGVQAKALLFYGVMIAYLLLIPVVGYLWASLAAGLATLLYQRVRAPLQYAAVLVLIAVIYFAFVHGLDVPLP